MSKATKDPGKNVGTKLNYSVWRGLRDMSEERKVTIRELLADIITTAVEREKNGGSK